MTIRTFSVLVAACIFGSSMVDAAEIRDDPSTLQAVLEGKIEPGDFEKVRSFIFEKDGIAQIYLASPGGDLAEAMKIGVLVRTLKLETVVPVNFSSPTLREKMAALHSLKNAKDNYMCASACFFIFVAGIQRRSEMSEEAILGIHKPYMSENALRELSGDNAIAAATRTRTTVEKYLKEMGVPARYADQMFAVSKDEIRWIGKGDFEADFSGFIPELRDWVNARCDSRTDVDKRIWGALKNKTTAQQSAAEKVMSEELQKKYMDQILCEVTLQFELSSSARKDHLDARNGRPATAAPTR